MAMGTLTKLAQRLMEELIKERGEGPWIEDFRDEMERFIKNTVFENLSMGEEARIIESCLTLISAVLENPFSRKDEKG